MQTLAEPRNRRLHRSRRGEQSAAATSASPAARATPVPGACDPEVKRVRDAGGPIDNAAYSCECGYQFVAPVSTTVHCPHCGLGQAW